MKTSINSECPKEPLLVIPGLFGTKIEVKDPKDEDKGLTVWPVVLKRNAHHLEYLKMVEPNIPSLPSQAKEFDLPYKELLHNLEKESHKYYEKDVTLFPIPYDWRYSLEKTVGTPDSESVSGQEPIARRIMEHADNSPTKKVDILCHSMGCLASFYYVMTNREDAWKYVNKIVFLAPPLWGTVESYKRIIGGFAPEAAQYLRTKTQWKEIFRNMEGIYQICPGKTLTDDALKKSFLAIIQLKFRLICIFIQKLIKLPFVSTASQDYSQSFALDGEKDLIEQVDGIINCGLLRRTAAGFRKDMDKALANDSYVPDDPKKSPRAFMLERSYLFWGKNGIRSTPDHLTCCYSSCSRQAAPSIKESLTQGDDDVLYLLTKQIPAAGQHTFRNTSHMDMLKSPEVINKAVDIFKCGETGAVLT